MLRLYNLGIFLHSFYTPFYITYMNYNNLYTSDNDEFGIEFMVVDGLGATTRVKFYTGHDFIISHGVPLVEALYCHYMEPTNGLS